MRVPPLPADQWDDDVDHALSGMLPAERRNPADVGNLLATLVRHPKLTRAFLRFNNHLLFSSTLPPRLRELAVLRVAHLSNSEYEWRHHVRMGQEAGLTDDVIDGIQRGVAADGLDRAILTKKLATNPRVPCPSEQGTHKPLVAGSNPASATITSPIPA